MYKRQQWFKNTIKRNTSYVGETIEQKVNRITNNREPIKDGAPPIYTDRSEGIKPDYDIRTDRWEHAIDVMEIATKAQIAKREARANKLTEKQKGTETKDGGTESAVATDNQ